MKIDIRQTHAFLELKVDVVTETIYHDHQQEIKDTIENFTEVLESLYDMLDKEIIINILDK